MQVESNAENSCWSFLLYFQPSFCVHLSPVWMAIKLPSCIGWLRQVWM